MAGQLTVRMDSSITIENLSAVTPESFQIMSMAAFNLAFVVALAVTSIDTILLVIRQVRGVVRKNALPGLEVK